MKRLFPITMPVTAGIQSGLQISIYRKQPGDYYDPDKWYKVVTLVLGISI